MTRVFINEDAEASSSEEEEEQELEMEAHGQNGAQEAADQELAPPVPPKRITIKLKGGPDVCHVCGKAGHTAGFVGAVYFDCPEKPCYLCSQPGHSTQTCPFRISPGHGCTKAADISYDSILTSIRKREGGGRSRPPQQPVRRQWQIEAAVLKLHSRRVACLEFHPRNDSLVLSGDKRGQIGVWDIDKVYERTVYSNINRWLTNVLRFMPGGDGSSCASASHDGTVKIFDVETGDHRTLYTANAQGWDAAGDEESGSWVTMIGMDVMQQAGVIVAGDSIGQIHLLDHRLSSPVASLQIHRKNTKVQSVAANPVDGHLIMTAGNDYAVRLLDVRNLTGSTGAATPTPGKGKGKASLPSGHPAELGCLPHPRVVNAAYFSPTSGRKILTTCQDNRIRVWDYIYSASQEADREIVHSQNFNRYLTPFKAEWNPKDPAERLVICGRYISEDFGGVALHPIDLLDAATGDLVGELTDPNLTTISPVNKAHPRREVILSGSSRSLYAWHPVLEEDEEGTRQGRGGAGGTALRPSRRDIGDDLPFGLQGSGHFLFFDADEEGDSGKKKKKGAKASGGSKEKSSGGSASTAKQAKANQQSKGQEGGRKRKKGDDSDQE